MDLCVFAVLCVQLPDSSIVSLGLVNLRGDQSLMSWVLHELLHPSSQRLLAPASDLILPPIGVMRPVEGSKYPPRIPPQVTFLGSGFTRKAFKGYLVFLGSGRRRQIHWNSRKAIPFRVHDPFGSCCEVSPKDIAGKWSQRDGQKACSVALPTVKDGIECGALLKDAKLDVYSAIGPRER